MQFARELVQAALEKGEQALSKIPAIVNTSALVRDTAVQERSIGGAPANSAAVEERVQRFRQELRASRINVDALKRLAVDGVPDRPGLRSLVWKVILGYLPPVPEEWPQALARRRTQYHVFCQELIVDPTRPMQSDNSLYISPSTEGNPDPLAGSTKSPSGKPSGQVLSPLRSAQDNSRHSTAHHQGNSANRSLPQHLVDLNLSAGGPSQVDKPLLPIADSIQNTPRVELDGSDPLQDPLLRTIAPPAHVSLMKQTHDGTHVQDDDPPSPFTTSQPTGGLSRQASERTTPNKAVIETITSLDTSGMTPEQKRASAAMRQLMETGWQLVETKSCSDHPLSLDAGSKWRVFFQDNEILEQITRDVMRTHPDLSFFTGESEESELHRQELRRALFMYAKLNPGLRYIQGMNELIAPLYYLFKHDPDPLERKYAEADAFWCFLELISEFRDHFCQQLDNSQTGIRATIRRLMNVLQHHDFELWQHIEITSKVDPQFYAFRWITLLLSQEFPFNDTLRVWDTILGDPYGRMDCLLRVCTAMILGIRQQLMQGDFTVILKTLQRYPHRSTVQLLKQAMNMPSCAEVLGQQV